MRKCREQQLGQADGVEDEKGDHGDRKLAVNAADPKAIRRATYQKFVKDFLRCVAAIDENIGRLLGYLDGMPDGGGKVEPLNADEIRRFRAGLRRNLIESDPVEKQGPPSSGDEGAAANGSSPL